MGEIPTKRVRKSWKLEAYKLEDKIKDLKKENSELTEKIKFLESKPNIENEDAQVLMKTENAVKVSKVETKDDDEPKAQTDENLKKEVVEESKEESEAPLDTQTKTLEVQGTNIQEVNEGKGDIEPVKANETLAQTPQASSDDIINKCGECGAVVDSSLICECGLDYN